MTSNINNQPGHAKSASAGSNRSASRSDPRGNRTVEPCELTAVDKKWGELFTSDGLPTARFVDAMTSLSRYIIKAFAMKESIVLIPEKMYSFYSFHSVAEDPFQYRDIFESVPGSHLTIAAFYRDLGCPYHLVQSSPSKPPSIPGLTPDGFARWMALHAQAFPDELYARLEKVISLFPLETVSTIDGKSERLPKQLSRYLLPEIPDYKTRALMQQAVKRHFGEAASLPAKSRRGVSVSEGEDDARPRKHDAIIAEHRRCSSYPGPASTQPPREREREKERELEKRDRCDMSRSRPSQDRRSTEPSRRASEDRDDIRSEPQASQQAQTQYRHHKHRNSYDSSDSYKGRHSSDRAQSPAAPRPLKSQHRGSASTAPSRRDSHDSRDRRDSRDSRDGRDGRDGHRSRNPPPSPPSSFLPSGRSTSTRRTSSPVRDGPGPLDRKHSSSSRRASSPQSRGYRASLPEIHHSGMEYSGRGYASRDPREARGNASETSSRRSSYIGSSGRGSIDSAPSSVSDRDRVDRADDKRPKLRDVCYKALERRDRDDKNYRMYGTTLPLSPLSTSPVLQYATAASTRDKNDKSDKIDKSDREEKPRSESANTKAKLVGSDTRKSLSTPNPPASGRWTKARPLSSLQATVVSEDRHDDDGNGSDSNQTWDEYLQSEDSH